MNGLYILALAAFIVTALLLAAEIDRDPMPLDDRDVREKIEQQKERAYDVPDDEVYDWDDDDAE